MMIFVKVNIMVDNLHEINNMAMSAMKDVNLEKAKNLFSYNARKNSSFLTHFNYASFLIEFHSDFCINAKKEIKNELLSAQTCHKSYLIDYAWGKLYLKTKKYRTAIKYFQKASTLTSSVHIYNNLGIAYFYIRNYKKALLYFQEASKVCAKEEASLIYESICITLILLKDFLEAEKYFKKIIDYGYEQITPQLIKIAYFCRDYEFIKLNTKNLFKEWIITPELLKILSNTIKREKNNGSKEFILDILKMQTTNILEQNTIKKYLSSKRQYKHFIKKKNFHPAHIFLCMFLGCKEHSKANIERI